jgi:hypothetical protein
MKTSELTGAALDWAVAKCEGLAVSDRATKWRAENCPHLYSTDWARGGPIIEREGIGFWSYTLDEEGNENPGWYAEKFAGFGVDGPTPLVAAMRCYVASVLGDEIVLPKELT